MTRFLRDIQYGGGQVLHMPRKGPKCRITPRLEGCLDNALTIMSELSLALGSVDSCLPVGFKGCLCVQSLRPQEIHLRSSTTGLPSEDRVRADISAVQEHQCPPSYPRSWFKSKMKE